MKAAVQAASNYSVDRAFLLKHFIPMQIDCWRMKALVSRKVTLPWQRGESNWRRCWEHWPRRGHQSELVDRLVMESNSVRPISTLSRLRCKQISRWASLLPVPLSISFCCCSAAGWPFRVRKSLWWECIDPLAPRTPTQLHWRQSVVVDVQDSMALGCCWMSQLRSPEICWPYLITTDVIRSPTRRAPRKTQLYDTIGVARITAKEENAQKTNIGIESGNRNLIYIDDWISKKTLLPAGHPVKCRLDRIMDGTRNPYVTSHYDP